MRFWRDKKVVNKNIPRRRNILLTERESKNVDGGEKSRLIFKIKLVFALVVVLSASVFFLTSSYFKVADVIVEGNVLIQTDAIRAEIPTGQNIFLSNTGDIEKNILKKMSEIKDIRVIRGIPNAYKVIVLERNPVMVWQTTGKNYLLSDQGEIIHEVPADKYTNLILVADKHNLPVSNATQIVSPNFVAFTLNLNNQFFNAVNIHPIKYEIQDTTFDMNVSTDAGFFVKFDTTRSSASQLENLKIVLAQKRPDIKEYVDLRIDGWVYYK
ncbi:MAG: FtsQ-type POTRA domain-containing protein [Candidatus Berkelbacteria bacterium]